LKYLEHLDEGDGQVDVGHVAEHETQTEEDADGDNGAEIDASSHGHLLPRVQHGCEAGQQLGHDGGEDQMPCCESNCCDDG
jgi:hypothetical protein